MQNKAIVTCGIAFGFAPSHGQVPTFGIGSIQGQDVADILSMGRVPKLLATARREGDSLCCTVEPVLVERGSLEAAVPLNNNLASLEAQGIGTLKFYGQGAGALPTGNAVVQDLLDIAQGCKDTPPRTGGALVAAPVPRGSATGKRGAGSGLRKRASPWGRVRLP